MLYGGSLDYLRPRLKDVNVLGKEECGELILKYQSGDIEAGKKVVKHNIKYVIKLAGSYAKRYPVEIDDLMAHGIMGLYKAMNKFEPDRGCTFSTYANKWVRQSIIRNVLWNLDLVNTKKSEHREQYHFKSLDDVDFWKGRDVCTTEDKYSEVIKNKKIREYINDIPDERTRSIMLHRFGLIPGEDIMVLGKIGVMHKLTRSRIQQIVAKQLRKMKESKKIRALVGRH